MKKLQQPFPSQLRKQLTREGLLSTVEGGTVGHEQDSKNPPSASSAEAGPDSDAAVLSTALSALSAMYEGYIAQDREQLDAAFETLVECIEEWRDAVPKA